MLFQFYYTTQIAMLGGFLLVLWGLDLGVRQWKGDCRIVPHVSNPVLCTVNCNFQIKEHKTKTLLIHLTAAINFQHMLCSSFCSIQQPLLHINRFSICLPREAGQTVNDSISSWVRGRAVSFFIILKEKDIFTVLRDRQKHDCLQ